MRDIEIEPQTNRPTSMKQDIESGKGDDGDAVRGVALDDEDQEDQEDEDDEDFLLEDEGDLDFEPDEDRGY